MLVQSVREALLERAMLAVLLAGMFATAILSPWHLFIALTGLVVFGIAAIVVVLVWPARADTTLPKPVGVVCSWSSLQKGVAAMFLGMSLAACLAAFPWFFSWSGVMLMIGTSYVFGILPINVGYHRLFTHRSFVTMRWVEVTLALLACAALQGSLIHWVAVHRLHHKESDEQPDPHTPLAHALWAHIGWMLWRNPEIDDRQRAYKYAAELVRDPFYRWLDKHMRWLWVWLAHVVLIFLLGARFGYVYHDGAWAQLGLSWVVWGVAVRTVVVWHVTWSINSITHVSGYRNYHTKDDSRNTWWLTPVAAGENWHNNHHADPNSAKHGHRWWEFDLTFWSIKFLELLGLAWDIKMPKHERIAHRKIEREEQRWSG